MIQVDDTSTGTGTGWAFLIQDMVWKLQRLTPHEWLMFLISDRGPCGDLFYWSRVLILVKPVQQKNDPSTRATRGLSVLVDGLTGSQPRRMKLRVIGPVAHMHYMLPMLACFTQKI
jgi:hypothetical protein